MPDDTKPPDPRVLQVIHAGRQQGKHSPLYLWMREHHATLQAEFEAHGPQWPQRTVAMGEAGLTDQTGKPPSVRTAMQTWYRVGRAMSKTKRAARPARSPATPGATVVRAAAATAPAAPSNIPHEPEPADDDGDGFVLQLAGGPKAWTPKKETDDV